MAEFFYKTNLVQNVLAKRRRKRAEFILSKVSVFLGMSILDVGCGPNGRSFEDFLPKDYKITGIDILDEKGVITNHPNFTYLKQDAQDLNMFKDNEFDLAVSIGMMEHVCDRAVLKKMYTEINRVSQQWVIVVPWKYAFLETHFKFPFFPLLPYFMQIFLTKALNLHNLRHSVKQDYNYIKNNYQWFSNSQWLNIFEGGKCYLTSHMDTIAIVKAKV